MDHAVLQSPDHVSGMICHRLCVHHPPWTVPEQTKDNIISLGHAGCDLALFVTVCVRPLELAPYKSSNLLTYLLPQRETLRNASINEYFARSLKVTENGTIRELSCSHCNCDHYL